MKHESQIVVGMLIILVGAIVVFLYHPRPQLNSKMAGEWTWSETLGDGSKSDMTLWLNVNRDSVSGTYDAVYNGGDKLDSCDKSGVPGCGIHGVGAKDSATVDFHDAYSDVVLPATIIYNSANDTIQWKVENPNDRISIFVPTEATLNRK